MQDVTFDFLQDYRDADSMYLCDAISEFADGRVSIYHSDIMDFLRNNPEAVERAIGEFGWDGCGGTLEKAAQMAEFMQIESELYDDLRNVDTNARIEDLADDDERAAMLRKVDEWRATLAEVDA